MREGMEGLLGRINTAAVLPFKQGGSVKTPARTKEQRKARKGRRNVAYVIAGENPPEELGRFIAELIEQNTAGSSMDSGLFGLGAARQSSRLPPGTPKHYGEIAPRVSEVELIRILRLFLAYLANGDDERRQDALKPFRAKRTLGRRPTTQDPKHVERAKVLAYRSLVQTLTGKPVSIRAAVISMFGGATLEELPEKKRQKARSLLNRMSQK